MQKLLFMCYGQALAIGEVLFRDDTPKAWPFGPVFPRTYKRYEEHIPTNLSDEEKENFAQYPDLLTMVARTVAKFSHYSATRLSDWSHLANSPWYKTVFGQDKTAWNRPIQENTIKEYFSNPNWEGDV